MNKKIIAVAVAAAFAAPMAAQAETKIYGKFHADLSSTKANASLNSNDSRIGFKGKAALDGSLSATYKAEFKVDLTKKDKDKAILESRNTFVGLKGGFGEVRIGLHDSPLKKAQGKFDQFGDTKGDIKNAGDQTGENRNEDTITYVGKFGNIGVMAQVSPGEGDGTDTGVDKGGKGFMDSNSIAVSYKAGPLYVAAAVDTHDKLSATNATKNTMNRIVATYKMSGMQFGLLSQSGVSAATATSGDEETWLGFSFGMKMGKGKIKAQLVNSEDKAATKTKTTLTAFGYDYKIGKKAKLYVMQSSQKKTDGTDSTDDRTSVGYILKF